MSMDTSQLMFPKGTPRVLEKITQKHTLAAQERLCRKLVKARDKGRCRVTGCKDAAAEMHHIVYRSHGGKIISSNCVSLCTLHHKFVHAGLLSISGDADKKLTFEGRTKP